MVSIASLASRFLPSNSCPPSSAGLAGWTPPLCRSLILGLPLVRVSGNEAGAVSKPIRIGLWGGSGGQPCQPVNTPSQLVSVVVCSGDAINSIQFIYKDNSDNIHENNLWGGPGGRKQRVDLEESEYVKEFSGTFGPWGSDVPRVITSLRFVTNTGGMHEFGHFGSGGSFHVPLDEGKITGFFGRAGDLIDAIGIYVLS